MTAGPFTRLEDMLLLFRLHPGETTAHAIARFKRAVAISAEEDAWSKRAGS